MLQVIMVVSEEAGLLYISYNLAWCVHVAHCVDFIFLFYEDKKHFAQIFQGYRKFYRYKIRINKLSSFILLTKHIFCI